MKKRVLIVICVLLLLFAAIWTVVSNSTKKDNAYNQAIAEADANLYNGLYTKSYEQYKLALSLKESKELRCRIIDNLAYIEEYATAEAEILDFLKLYPQEPEPYEYICLYSERMDNIGAIYEYADTMKKRGIHSDLVDELCMSHKYDYSEMSSRFVEVDPFYYGYSRVRSKSGLYGYINTNGVVMIEPQYDLAVADTNCGYLLVSKTENDKKIEKSVLESIDRRDIFKVPAESKEIFGTYFIDYYGTKKIVDTQKRNFIFEDIQAYGSDMMAVCENGAYRYIDYEFNTVEDGKTYYYAGVYNQGVAPVMTSSGWMIIDEKQNQIGNEFFEDIKLDEAKIAVYNGLFWGRKSDGWYLYNLDGTRITQTAFEDCSCSFVASEPIAAKKNGKWGFIDSDGQTVIDFKYDEARSFAHGMAAVAVDGLWGMINSEETMIVEPQYLMVYEVTSDGAVPVETEEGWTLLQFYSMK